MVRVKRSALYNDGYVVKELSQVGVTSHNNKQDLALSSLTANSRSGSGFFSSFTSVLPAIFSLSNSPDKDSTAPPDKDLLGQNPSTTAPAENSQGHGVLDANNKQATPPSSDAITMTTGKTPQTAPSNTIKMGNERAIYSQSTGKEPNGANSNSDNASNTSNSANSANHTTTPTDTTPANLRSNSFSNSTASPAVSNNSNARSNSFSSRPNNTNPAEPTLPQPGTSQGPPKSTESARDIDVQLFLQLNSYLKTIEDQLRGPNSKKAFEPRLEAYAPYALAEFNQHLARYHQWELKNEDPPRIMPLPFVRMGEG